MYAFVLRKKNALHRLALQNFSERVPTQVVVQKTRAELLYQTSLTTSMHVPLFYILLPAWQRLWTLDTCHLHSTWIPLSARIHFECMTPPSPIRQLEVFLKARMEKAYENVSDDATQKSFRNASDLLDQEECLRFCFRNKPPGTGVHFKNAFNALPTSLWSEDESWLLHQTSLNMYVLNCCIDLEKIARRLQKMFRRRSNWIQTHIPALGVTAQLAEMQRHQHSK